MFKNNWSKSTPSLLYIVRNYKSSNSIQYICKDNSYHWIEIISAVWILSEKFLARPSFFQSFKWVKKELPYCKCEKQNVYNSTILEKNKYSQRRLEIIVLFWRELANGTLIKFQPLSSNLRSSIWTPRIIQHFFGIYWWES